MGPREIRPKVYWVGAIDWDRRLFDALIPLPDGTSYNSYLVKGSEKTALIDTVDPTMQDVLINNLNQLGVKTIDYVVANHAEQARQRRTYKKPLPLWIRPTKEKVWLRPW